MRTPRSRTTARTLALTLATVALPLLAPLQAAATPPATTAPAAGTPAPAPGTPAAEAPRSVPPPAPMACSGPHWSQTVTVEPDGTVHADRWVSDDHQRVTVPLAVTPGTWDIREVMTWSGYADRLTYPHPDEQVQVQFEKAGVVQASTTFTPDLADTTVSAFFRGPLGSVTLPQGADSITWVHVAATRPTTGLNIVKPVAICLQQQAAPTVTATVRFACPADALVDTVAKAGGLDLTASEGSGSVTVRVDIDGTVTDVTVPAGKTVTTPLPFVDGGSFHLKVTLADGTVLLDRTVETDCRPTIPTTVPPTTPPETTLPTQVEGEVIARTDPSDELAYTGTLTWVELAAAAGLLGAGGWLVRRSKRIAPAR